MMMTVYVYAALMKSFGFFYNSKQKQNIQTRVATEEEEENQSEDLKHRLKDERS